MISLRSVRELLTEAISEAIATAQFLIRKADERYVLPKEKERQ